MYETMADNKPMGAAPDRADAVLLDRSEAIRFLSLLDPAHDDAPFTFQTLDDDKTRKDGSLNRTLNGRIL